MRLGPSLRLLPLVALVVSACSGKIAPGPAGPVSVEQACSDYASALCSKASSCSPFYMLVTYGDTTTCESRVSSVCQSAFAADGTSLTTSRAESCATALGKAGCDAIYDRNPPAECRATLGALTNGAACGDDNQCASAYCAKVRNAVCGTCEAARGQAGDACAIDDNCDYGLKCTTKGLCSERGDIGADCDQAGHKPCKSALVCNGSNCAVPVAEGAACMPPAGLGGCNLLSGDYCDAQVCRTFVVAEAGRPCNYYTVCARNGLCRTVSTSGTCIGAAVDGAPCDAMNGPPCIEGARCVSGVCRKLDASTCN